MILSLPDAVKGKYDVSGMRQLLVSSAPVRQDTKVAILISSKTRNCGSIRQHRAGLVTLCRPEDQLRKLGTIGREIFGIDRIKVLDEEGNEVPDGQVGELYARNAKCYSKNTGTTRRKQKKFLLANGHGR